MNRKKWRLWTKPRFLRGISDRQAQRHERNSARTLLRGTIQERQTLFELDCRVGTRRLGDMLLNSGSTMRHSRAGGMHKSTSMSQRVLNGHCLRLWAWLSRVMAVGSVCFCCLSPTSASAGAFRIFDQSASGTAQGGAFAAQADDASAIYYNPAGMTQLNGVQTSFGVLLAGGHTTYTSPTGQTVKG